MAYLHSLDPFAIQITESFGIRWYGLSYLAGFCAGYLIIRWLSKRGLSQLQGNLIGDFVFGIAIGTVLGGRLGYCLFYKPSLFLEFSGNFPFWGALSLNEGGMASHGGIIGIVLACIWFARKHKISALHLCDLTTLGGCLGIFFGRIANFVNGELVGRPASESLPWAVKFPQDILSWPSQAFEKLSSLAETVQSIGIAKDTWSSWLSNLHSDPSAWQQISGALNRIILEVQSGNQRVQSLLSPLLAARHPSQLYEALLEGALLFCVLFLIWRKPQKPGVIAGWFFTLYALVRIIGEQFRMPDLHIGFELFGLTRGQWLSIVMLFLGLMFLRFCTRREVSSIGGWGVGH